MWIILFFLIASIIINIVLTWYARRVIKDLLFVSDNIGDFLGILLEYQDHLEGLYELDMFYGDETLKALMQHTTFVTEEIKRFESIYNLTRYEGTNDETGNFKEEEKEEEKESLFYEST